MVRMFSTARTLRRYFSMAASLSADWWPSVLAASRASISRSSGPWMSCPHRKTRSVYLLIFSSGVSGGVLVLTPGMLETISKVTPQPGTLLRWDILFRRLWAKPWERPRTARRHQPSGILSAIEWGKTLLGGGGGGVTDLPPRDADADALPEDELHAGGVAQLQRRLHRQVHPPVGRRRPAQLGALVDRGVPGSLRLQLNT